MNRPDDTEPDAVPPACGPTVDRVQFVLDGVLPSDSLTTDPHALACPTCRERIRAALLVLAALDERPEPVTIPVGLTDAVLAGVRADRRARARRSVFAFTFTGGLVAAAAVLVAVWLSWPQKTEVVENVPHQSAPAPTPEPEPTPSPAPPPRPIRIGDELAKAGDALRDTSRTITEPAAAAPRLFSALTDPLFKAPPMPMADELEPARRSLAEIPEAAKTGLEPVTDSAQKAFSRLLRDVGGMQPKLGS